MRGILSACFVASFPDNAIGQPSRLLDPSRLYVATILYMYTFIPLDWSMVVHKHSIRGKVCFTVDAMKDHIKVRIHDSHDPCSSQFSYVNASEKRVALEHL